MTPNDPSHSYDTDTPPERYHDIGPYYAGLGILLLIATLLMVGWREVNHIPWNGWAITIVCLLLLAVFLLIRPRFIDRHVKDIADALPTPYKKPPGE
jgi:hypothetical protein